MMRNKDVDWEIFMDVLTDSLVNSSSLGLTAQQITDILSTAARAYYISIDVHGAVDDYYKGFGDE